MIYKHIVSGIFIERPNRFIAIVEINGIREIAHVKNTGRCKELLVKGCTVFLSLSDNLSRKTKYDIISVLKIRDGKEPILINMDSQVVNDVMHEWLLNGNIFSSNATIKREVTYKNSRFDFMIEHGKSKSFLEVKGVTLEKNGKVFFPDAPTQRGVKHIYELIECINEGYGAYIVFVIQMDEIAHFSPNIETHPEFAIALKKAFISGVNILCLNCNVKENSITINQKIRYSL
jgi:sugar fermentation stimulation protein A